MSTGHWRAMRLSDIPAVVTIADAVHGELTESAEVFAERLALYPAGCFLLERDGEAVGHLVSHPWPRRTPVPLDVLLGAIPADADSFYLHDLALLPAARGSGAGVAVIRQALVDAASAGYREASLVAVHGADSFWARQGFRYVDDEVLARKLQSYGEGTFFMERPLP